MHKNLIKLLVKRGLFPATDTGKRRYPGNFLHILFFYYMPGIGIILFLSLIAFAHLWLSTQKVELEGILEDAKTSPYMAIFGESTGRVFVTKRQKADNTVRNTDSDELTWNNLLVSDLISATDMDFDFDDLKVFRSIFPFSTVYMGMTNINKEHLKLVGLALPFRESDPMNIGDINSELLDRIKDETDYWPFTSNEDVEGIILDEYLLKKLGFNPKSPPRYLGVRNSEGDEDIWLPVTVVRKIPYYHYLISVKTWFFLKNRFYYEVLDQTKIFLLNGHDKTEIDALISILPSGSESGGPELVGNTPALRVFLPPDISTATLLEKLVGHNKRWKLFYDFEYNPMDASYNGAMFYLNPEILNHQYLNKDILEKLQQRMERTGAFELKGDLIRTLKSAWESMTYLKRNISLFRSLTTLFVAILAIFVSMSMHIRLYRLGVLRMMGAKVYQFILAYFIEGLVYIIVAFIISWAGFQAYIGHLDVNNILIFGTGTLQKMIVCYILGMVIPSLYYFRLEPSEMTNYRNN